MRKEYELTQEEYDEIIDACKPVPYMVIAGIPPRSPQENANAAWRRLGNKHGFDGMTVTPSNKGKMFFTAEVIEDDDELPRSSCCAVDMPNWPDSDLCPRCKEHTGVLEDE